jgi:hypothetical protein
MLMDAIFYLDFYLILHKLQSFGGSLKNTIIIAINDKISYGRI